MKAREQILSTSGQVELSSAKDLNKDTAIEHRRLKRIVVTRGQKEWERL